MMGREIFFSFYANLPLNVRREVILDLGPEKGGPITWEVAYREINANSPLGDEILKRLQALKFIPTHERSDGK